MPTPDAAPVPPGTEYIELADFSAGIHADRHGSVSPRFTASDTQRGALMGNGIARVDGTSRCHADKTGALVPLPKALATGPVDSVTPGRQLQTERPYRYVLDAQIGNELVDGNETTATPWSQTKRRVTQIMWGSVLATRGGGTFYTATVIGREYRSWLTFPTDSTATIDFLAGTTTDDNTIGNMPLPGGSLTQGRFYYGYTTAGRATVTADGDTSFRPLWFYPVTVASASTPWFRWGAGNRWLNGAFIDAGGEMGLANDPVSPHAVYSPGIGLKGLGTCVIGMEFIQNSATFAAMPMPTILGRWLFHYSERGNVPQNAIYSDISGGPINPSFIIQHQGRILIADKRRTGGGYASSASSMDHGYMDDMLFYSDAYLPTQNFMASPGLAADKGQANAAYGEFVQTTQEVYNKLPVADDAVTGIGTIGVITIDQLLVVKHVGGGAAVSGDLDNPTIHRLPYIESTGGVVCKGVSTPIGFVYGSDNGIFAWQGGDSTQKLSPQLDGFFWDHVAGDANYEKYSACRGRMGHWNDLVLVPNNYVYDIEKQSWWRLAVQTLAPIESTTTAPYNCYDVDQDGTLYAFPYRHSAPRYENGALFPADVPTAVNTLSIPDAANISAPSQLDIRFALVDGGTAGATLIGHTDGANSRSYIVKINGGVPSFATSTDGTAGTVITATCDTALTSFNNSSPMLLRVTWRASDGRVQFFYKAPGDIATQIALHTGWTQMGANKLAAVAALFNSTANLVIGNQGSAAVSVPLYSFTVNPTYIFAVSLATTIAAAPVFSLIPADFPSNTAAASFPCSTGQTVTVTKGGTFPLSLTYTAKPDTPPVWYTFDKDVLDSEYTWASQPLLESVDRELSIQSIELVTTGASTAVTPATVDVTLEGFDGSGTSIVSPIVTSFTLALTANPQMLRKDVAPNFVAKYVTLKLHALDSNGNPAPKIHSVKLGYKQRARSIRRG